MLYTISLSIQVQPVTPYNLGWSNYHATNISHPSNSLTSIICQPKKKWTGVDLNSLNMFHLLFVPVACSLARQNKFNKPNFMLNVPMKYTEFAQNSPS